MFWKLVLRSFIHEKGKMILLETATFLESAIITIVLSLIFDYTKTDLKSVPALTMLFFTFLFLLLVIFTTKAYMRNNSNNLMLFKELGSDGIVVFWIVMTQILMAVTTGGILGFFGGSGILHIVGKNIGEQIDTENIIISVDVLTILLLTFAGSIFSFKRESFRMEKQHH